MLAGTIVTRPPLHAGCHGNNIQAYTHPRRNKSRTSV